MSLTWTMEFVQDASATTVSLFLIDQLFERHADSKRFCFL